MAPELSSNWKKLQANLRREVKNSRSEKIQPSEPTRQQQNSIAKRKRLEAKRNSIPVTPTGFSIKEAGMGLGNRILEKDLKESTTSVSLALWAEENDISAKDLVEAYGVGLKDASVEDSNSGNINAGLSRDVEVGQYVAMDCEMVGVGGDEDRSVLARVSIVNFHGTQVYDSFVRPKEYVTDWRTHVSGVSAKDMATARPFDEVRDEVEELLKDRVLVGHAIKHDLEVIMLGHPKRDIRDTSRFAEFRKYSCGKTPSLKKLAKEVLGVDIQGGQHSSIEDARATMLLFRRHKQAFDAEAARKFPQRKSNNGGERPNPKRKVKSKR